jgi:hypothetical protein
MTPDAESEAEQDVLAQERAELLVEQKRLESHPGDVAGHIEYLRAMHVHLDRQRTSLAARRAPKRLGEIG